MSDPIGRNWLVPVLNDKSPPARDLHIATRVSSFVLFPTKTKYTPLFISWFPGITLMFHSEFYSLSGLCIPLRGFSVANKQPHSHTGPATRLPNYVSLHPPHSCRVYPTPCKIPFIAWCSCRIFRPQHPLSLLLQYQISSWLKDYAKKYTYIISHNPPQSSISYVSYSSVKYEKLRLKDTK